jgi:fatty-acyl-CoA synthase
MPDEVNVVDELPRTSVGKLDKKLLRKEWDEK